MLAELPSGYSSQSHYIALTTPTGEMFTGLQSGEFYVKWKRFDKRVALIQPNLGTRSTGDQGGGVRITGGTRRRARRTQPFPEAWTAPLAGLSAHQIDGLLISPFGVEAAFDWLCEMICLWRRKSR